MDASELQLKYAYNTCFTINELLYMITYDLKTEKDLNKQSFSFKQQTIELLLEFWCMFQKKK